ncbi:MAG TPA: 2Fe-2S iron-sulfur cluster-binding protein [Casimicrobiaceae bacterium]|nr:2Fe-2S iron-sulfur cluster-binding protein [Casimicrobiaceae bacterium]
MPEIFIDGRPVQAERSQTVLEAALANGFDIPYFCWHPALSVAGNCRICAVQIEGRSWAEIACNMPASEGLRVLTDSEVVREYRKSIMQLLTLNHPVDCGICDKAGECKLQDYHYRYNGEPSLSADAKVRATKFHALSERIVLDNERCILCSRCVRFTREISKSNALGIVRRGDQSLVRAAEDRPLDADPYSDNVVDLCPVGALLSRSFLYKARVWYLEATRSVCPGCARGCNVQIWHRKAEWKLNALDPRLNARIERVTPLENREVNGSWICNKGRDLAAIFERPRALQATRNGQPVDLETAVDSARGLLAVARHPVALVSSWGSNEELESFSRTLGSRVAAVVKQDWTPVPGERLDDDLLIRADKNPNGAAARALFPRADDPSQPLAPNTDLVLVWGEGFDFGRVPQGAKTVVLDAYLHPESARADVFIPISIQTERRGHYTNFEGVVSAFEPCCDKPATVADAEALFAALAMAEEVRA